jgi:hypothetical protein
MIIGKGNQPRVLHISIARFSRDLPRSGESLRFLVSIHEEGTGITWQQNVTVSPETERVFLDLTGDLYTWSLNEGLTPRQAGERIRRLGTLLYESFIGEDGDKVLAAIPPTAVLLDVDETILNLPWELIGEGGYAISQGTPFGRLVTTRTVPRPTRDPSNEDTTVRILAVGNPTLDLEASELEIEAIKGLEGKRDTYDVEVTVIPREKATKGAFAGAIAAGSYDIIHFAGHGDFNPDTPEKSNISFSDGVLSAEEVFGLKWKSPPYIVFNSACESGRAAGGKRLVSRGNRGNGLAAAFIAAGVSAYAGYFWPVSDDGAALFAETFYKRFFFRENVGSAFLEARQRTALGLEEAGDLTAYSAVYFGDAGSEERRDLAKV